MASAVLLSRWAGRAVPAGTRGRRFYQCALTLALMAFFGVVTGWSSPLVRAFAYGALLQIARAWQVRPSRTRVFLLSLLAAALCGHSSFLSLTLSACGMAGVLLFGSGGFLSHTLGPWLCTLPLVVWFFGIASAAAPLWNLTFAPLVGLLVLPLAILDLLCKKLGLPLPVLGNTAAQIMGILNQGLLWGDRWLGLAFWVDRRLFLLFLCLLVLLLLWRQRRPCSLLPGALACLLPLLWLFLPSVKLAVLDVGQGDGIFLRTKGGDTVLVDGGPPYWRRPGAPVTTSLERLAIGPVDHLLLTHTDRDHEGGLPFVLLRHEVRKALWVRPETLADKKIFPLLAAAERASVPVRFLRENSHPPGLPCWLPPFTVPNESSPFCRGELAGGRSVWLTGDAGFAAESWLLRQGKIPQADFLKVGHHGSKYSSSPAFLAATGARTALISVGRKNRYGHPTPETMERLRRQSMEIRRTDREGSLVYY
jgi:competence protein ComEC